MYAVRDCLLNVSEATLPTREDRLLHPQTGDSPLPTDKQSLIRKL